MTDYLLSLSPQTVKKNTCSGTWGGFLALNSDSQAEHKSNGLLSRTTSEQNVHLKKSKTQNWSSQRWKNQNHSCLLAVRGGGGGDLSVWFWTLCCPEQKMNGLRQLLTSDPWPAAGNNRHWWTEERQLTAEQSDDLNYWLIISYF